jgi:serine protease Do
MLISHIPRRLTRCRILSIILAIFIACCAEPAVRADDAADIASAKSLSRAFRAVSKRIMPSVVKIRTASRPRVPHVNPATNDRATQPDSPFENFFSDRDSETTPARSPTRRAVGSGVIIDPKGVILTNHHVVAGADEVTVELGDGRQFSAFDVKSDEQSDLAIVRIKADHGLPAAALGDSDKLQVGDWVLAVGHPFDLDVTVSSGIIGGKARVLPSGRRVDFLQTDAVINPGNSGGPLVNLDGEVVGINTAIASNSGSHQGVGFAVPVNLAKWVVGQLLQTGTVERAYLGVRVEEIRGDKAEQLGIEPGQGVLVAKVFPDTPAAKAGLRADDRIVKFAGREVHSPRQLQESVEQSKPGVTQAMEIMRDGKPLSVEIVVSPLPRSFGLVGAILREPQAAGDAEVQGLGLRIGGSARAEIEQRAYSGSRGALVTEVEPGGAAAKAGIRAGALIEQVGDTTVASAAEFNRAMTTQAATKGVTLLIRTPDGGTRLVQLKR